jgi:hypothetical protein
MNWEKTLSLIIVGGISAIIILDLVSSPNTAPILSTMSNGAASETNLLVGNIPNGYKHNPSA